MLSFRSESSCSLLGPLDLDLDSVIDTNSSEYDMIKFKDQSHGNIPMK